MMIILFAARTIQSLLRQFVLWTDHDGAASRNPSIKENSNLVFKKKFGEIVFTYLRNCGRNEFHPGADCFKVKYNSKVLVVNGSNLTVPNFLLSSGPSPSKLIYNVQPLKPQSSESASSRMSSEIFCNRPQGSSTSPQER